MSASGIAATTPSGRLQEGLQAAGFRLQAEVVTLQRSMRFTRGLEPVAWSLQSVASPRYLPGTTPVGEVCKNTM